MRFTSSDKGAAAVEFAIIAPIFLLILLFAIDAGRVFFVKISLLNAASQGARAAALGLNVVDVTQVARESAPGVISMSGSGASDVEVIVDVACPLVVTPDSTDMAVVTASVEYVWSTPLALVRVFDATSNRPGAITVASSSEWLCQ